MRTATVYNFLIEANIMASLAILLMIPVRLFFRRKLGNKALCFAWLLVAIRLLCPLALPNPIIHEIESPYNWEAGVVRPIAGQVKVRLTDAVRQAYLDAELSASQAGETDAERLNRTAAARNWWGVLTGMDNGRNARYAMIAYLTGAGAVTAWFAVANIRFRHRMRKNRFEPLSGEALEQYRALCARYGVKPVPVYWTDPLPSACLVGVIRPYIALPLAASPALAQQMLAHEICHLRARDHIWTLVQLLCCAVHWFNPLVWAAAAMCRMDRELKCDDNVTKDMEDEQKRLYAGTLIQSVTKRTVPGMPVLATGMSMTGRRLKTRVGGILGGGKRARALAAAFAVTASLLLVCAFATASTAPDEEIVNGDAQGTELTRPEDQFRSFSAQEFAALPTVEGFDEEHPIKTLSQAAAWAKTLWGGDLFRMDLTGCICSVGLYQYENEDYTTMTLPDGREIEVRVQSLAPEFISVMIQTPEGGHLGASFLGSGKVEYMFNDVLDNYAADYADPLDTDEERGLLKGRLLEIAERLDPGVMSHVVKIYDDGDRVDGDKRYSAFELYVDKGDPRTICVLRLPDGELQVVEYGSGNG